MDKHFCSFSGTLGTDLQETADLGDGFGKHYRKEQKYKNTSLKAQVTQAGSQMSFDGLRPTPNSPLL